MALTLEREGSGRFAYACEEALGYSLTPAVRDKDGISAAIAIADLAARCRERGESLLDRWHALGRRFGVWASAAASLVVQGRPVAEAVSGVLDRVAHSPPARLGTRRVLFVHDYRVGAEQRSRWLPAAPLVELELEGGRVLLRPSGTEPKLKCYVDLTAAVPEGASVALLEHALASEAEAVAAELVRQSSS